VPTALANRITACGVSWSTRLRGRSCDSRHAPTRECRRHEHARLI